MGIEATNTVSTQIEMKVGLTRKEVEHTNNSEAIKLFDLLDDGDGVLSQNEVKRYNNPVCTINDNDYFVGLLAEASMPSNTTFAKLDADGKLNANGYLELTLDDFVQARSYIENEYQFRIGKPADLERAWGKKVKALETRLAEEKELKAGGIGALLGLAAGICSRGQMCGGWKGAGITLLFATVAGAGLMSLLKTYVVNNVKGELDNAKAELEMHAKERRQIEKERDIFFLALDRAVAAQANTTKEI